MRADGFFRRVELYLEDEVDPEDRRELEALLRRSQAGDGAALQDLESRFDGPPSFGTAGIRGILGAGESRMNRSLVLKVTDGLAAHLLDTIPGGKERGVALARDGRHLSDVFQKDAAAVLSARGIAVH